jgi:hypothetical protein
MSVQAFVVRLAWPMYRNCFLTGISVAAVSYGMSALLSGVLPVGLIVTLPLIVGFCAIASLPAALIGVTAAAVFHHRRPSASEAEWRRLGIALGAAAVVLLFVPLALHLGALGSNAGIAFWATFLVAGCVAGARGGTLASKTLAAMPAPSGDPGAA